MFRKIKETYKKFSMRVVGVGLTALIVGSVLLNAGNALVGGSAYADGESSSATESAMTRVINQIKLSALGAEGTGSSEKLKFSESEFKTIGFFLSNYYSPFVTQVSSDGFEEDITKVLTESVGLNEDSSKFIANGVSSLSSKYERNKLKLYHSQDGGQTWEPTGANASYYDVLFGSTKILTDELLGDDGQFSLKGRYKWKDSNSLVGIGSESHEVDGKLPRDKVAYEWNPSPSGGSTMSQLVFYSNFKLVNSAKTWGSSFLYLFSEDEEIQKKIEEALSSNKPLYNSFVNYAKGDADKLNLKWLYKNSVYDSRMEVDVFGNLVAEIGMDNAKKSFVVLPASQNPMRYAKKTEGKGSSNYDEWFFKQARAEKTGVGYNLPVNNLNTIALIESGALNKSGDSVSSSVDTYIRPILGSNNVIGWDEGAAVAGWMDLGSIANDMLITQFLIHRVDYGVSKETKASITKELSDLGKYTSLGGALDQYVKGIDYKSLKDGKKFLVFPANEKGLWGFGFDGGKYENNYKAFERDGVMGAAITGSSKYSKHFKSSVGDEDMVDFANSLSSNGGVIDTVVSFDKFGLDKNSWDGIDSVGETVKKTNLLNGDSLAVSISTGKVGEDGFWMGTASDGSLSETGVLTAEGAKNYAVNLYMSYLITRANPDSESVDYLINLEGTPEVDLSAVSESEDGELSSDEQDAILKNMAYYMLNPTKGREYKQRWSKTTMNSIILASLQDMVGANTSSTYGGTTRYVELTGFGTIPRLNEVKLTAYLYDNFTQLGIFILILAFLLLLYFVFTKQVAVVPAFLMMVALGFMIYTPPKLINSLINQGNSISGTFYRDKFYFWALYQHQNYEDSLSQLADYGAEGNSNSYNQLLLQLQGGSGENDDVYEWQQTLGSVVKVRWMAPKKDGYVEQIKRNVSSAVTSDTSSTPAPSEEGTSSSSSDSSSSSSARETVQADNQTQAQDGGSWTGGGLTTALINQGVSNQDYTGLDTNYLYRGYTDIADYSRFYYGNIMGDKIVNSGDQNHQAGDYSKSLSSMFPVVDGADSASLYVKAKEQRADMIGYLSPNGGEESLKERAEKGFINDRKEATTGDLNKQYLKRVFAPIGSDAVSTTSRLNIDNVKVGDTVGLSKNYFMASIRDFNNHGAPFSEILSKLNEDYGGTTIDSGDAVSLSTFALYTESPFYYFSWYLYDQGLQTQKGSSGEFKTMMLENNDSFFYNYKIQEGSAGYGAMKDFMDFGTFFKVIVPYLREANEPLLQWSDRFGTRPYDGYGSTIQGLDAITDKNSEAYYKTWHNVMSDNLYRTYSGWVDAMYDLDMAKPEEIQYGGLKQTVNEPLNPASYELRPMIFSESEMIYYGVKDYELTKVEQAIIQTNRDIRNDWLQLMNYYQLDDVVLNTAASMIVTFNFNKNFSQTGFMQEQIVLEPQGFELKTFGWDGYLRLILQNATGESIQYNQELKSDIYEIVAEKDGTMTLIMMWLQSFVVVYVMPTMLVLVLIILPIAMLLSVLASFVRRDNRAVKVFTRDCLAPFLYILLTNIALSWSVSKLMGDAGTTLVTGDLTGTANFSSPRTTVGILMFLSGCAVGVYFLSLRSLVTGLWKNGKVLTVPVKAVVESAGSFTLSALTGRMNSLLSADNPTSSGYSRGGSSSGGGGASSSKSPEELSHDNLNSPSSRRTRLRHKKSTETDGYRSREAQERVNGILNKRPKPKVGSSDLAKSSTKANQQGRPTTFQDLVNREKEKDTRKKVSDILDKK